MNSDDKDYHEARTRVRDLRGFYSHVLAYVAINAVLIVINLAVSPNNLWFYWVAGFWGIGLFFHGLDAFTIRGKQLSSEREERKTRDAMDQKRRKAG